MMPSHGPHLRDKEVMVLGTVATILSLGCMVLFMFVTT